MIEFRGFCRCGVHVFGEKLEGRDPQCEACAAVAARSRTFEAGQRYEAGRGQHAAAARRHRILRDVRRLNRAIAARLATRS